jgi:hypothetical protein
MQRCDKGLIDLAAQPQTSDPGTRSHFGVQVDFPSNRMIFWQHLIPDVRYS